MSRPPETRARAWRLSQSVLILLTALAVGPVFAAPASSAISSQPEPNLLPPPGCPDCEPEPDCDPEICDGEDNDCDGQIDEGVKRNVYRDADGDGHGTGAAQQGCLDHGWVLNNNDCNDANASIWQAGRFYRDADGDGYGAPGNWIDSCGLPAGYVADATDCNDGNSTVKPGAIKQCGQGACARSVQACVNGVEQACVPYAASAEICDRIDNNCNGQVDDLPPISCGTGACQRTVAACGNICEWVVVQDGKPPVEFCEWGDNACTPGVAKAETCNNVDDNCNGTIDDGVQLTYYSDNDADGYGAGAPIGAGCSVPGGASSNSQDCNDSNYAVKPGALKHCGLGVCAASVQACVNGAEQTCIPRPSQPEICDKSDNDCNGQVDDLPPISCGQGACRRTAPACGELCEWVETHDGKPPVQVCEWGEYGTCTPGTPTAEVCANGLDEDCTGFSDDSSNSAAWLTFYPDQDHDGYGTSWGETTTCRQPADTSRTPGDCDDTRADMKPGAAEVCDGIDNNCSGALDESGVCDQSLCQ
ncbi:putative metal-binding motif-containing protein [Myxococcus llanfairpwllgwyngyllgogerychwyrndrobwllllantysiliogogogochensis]|nr:putative metal-binding motif-containing protein [Myxococcus llanfairpwllgwyngyllgogerychwyrndrobwllllantysiliogogogochensis]